MSKETKNKKNPLLDEDTSNEEETGADSTENESGDNQVDEKPKPKAPKKAGKAPAPVAPVAKVDIAQAALSDIRATKQILDAEEQVHFLIPLAEGEKSGSVHDCFINGYKVTVKKGVMTKIPRSVAELLANYYKISSEAGADFRLDRNKDKEDALS
jgi:hypothetical protein